MIESITEYYNAFKNHYNKKYRHITISKNDLNSMNDLNSTFSEYIELSLKENMIDDKVFDNLIKLIDLKLKHHEKLFETTDIIDIISNDERFITYENLIRMFNIDTYKYLQEELYIKLLRKFKKLNLTYDQLYEILYPIVDNHKLYTIVYKSSYKKRYIGCLIEAFDIEGDFILFMFNKYMLKRKYPSLRSITNISKLYLSTVINGKKHKEILNKYVECINQISQFNGMDVLCFVNQQILEYKQININLFNNNDFIDIISNYNIIPIKKTTKKLASDVEIVDNENLKTIYHMELDNNSYGDLLLSQKHELVSILVLTNKTTLENIVQIISNFGIDTIFSFIQTFRNFGGKLTSYMFNTLCFYTINFSKDIMRFPDLFGSNEIAFKFIQYFHKNGYSFGQTDLYNIFKHNINIDDFTLDDVDKFIKKLLNRKKNPLSLNNEMLQNSINVGKLSGTLIKNDVFKNHYGIGNINNICLLLNNGVIPNEQQTIDIQNTTCIVTKNNIQILFSVGFPITSNLIIRYLTHLRTIYDYYEHIFDIIQLFDEINVTIDDELLSYFCENYKNVKLYKYLFNKKAKFYIQHLQCLYDKSKMTFKMVINYIASYGVNVNQLLAENNWIM